ncbi:hypothetical protein ABT224_18460 [Streptomyces sp. NPDC001584]|uniref:hypothetical protein n=1 Tax=Streptomyces sp. NPDC001584 TaxID=3154521 RepID=UPI0033205744
MAWAALRQCAALPWLLGRAVDAGVREGSPAAAAGYAGAFALAALAEYAGMRGPRGHIARGRRLLTMPSGELTGRPPAQSRP